MKLSILVLSLVLVSCGARTKTKYVQNPYDDSALKGRLGAVESKILVLEQDRQDMMNQFLMFQSQLDGFGQSQAQMSLAISGVDSRISGLEGATAEQIAEIKARLDAVEAASVTLSTSLEANKAADIQAAIDAGLALQAKADELYDLGVGAAVYLLGAVNTVQSNLDLAISQAQSSFATKAELQTQVVAAQASLNALDGRILSLEQGNGTVTKVIDPCGDGPGFDEVLFEIKIGGVKKIFGSFSDNASGLNTRFSQIVPGSYVTTDATGCHFTVLANGTVI